MYLKGYVEENMKYGLMAKLHFQCLSWKTPQFKVYQTAHNTM